MDNCDFKQVYSVYISAVKYLAQNNYSAFLDIQYLFSYNGGSHLQNHPKYLNQSHEMGFVLLNNPKPRAILFDGSGVF